VIEWRRLLEKRGSRVMEKSEFIYNQVILATFETNSVLTPIRRYIHETTVGQQREQIRTQQQADSLPLRRDSNSWRKLLLIRRMQIGRRADTKMLVAYISSGGFAQGSNDPKRAIL
jgi:hypothetical protein